MSSFWTPKRILHQQIRPKDDPHIPRTEDLAWITGTCFIIWKMVLEKQCFCKVSQGPETGHWKATEHFFGEFTWNILYTNLDLKGGLQGPGRGASPCSTPLRSRFLYRMFHLNFPKKCPVAFQLPVRGSESSGRPAWMISTWVSSQANEHFQSWPEH